jgi:ketosteroid isomerase-like protein
MRTAREVTEELIRLSVTDDIAQVDLFAEDAVHELPFSPTGTPIRFTREQLRVAMSRPGPSRVVDRSLVRMEIEESKDGATVLAEYDITGTLAATGQSVSVAGAMVVTARDGLIVRSRNYLNPDVLRLINTPTS